MNRVVLLKYGEIVLKGLNRNYFNGLLLKRVKQVLGEIEGSFKHTYAQSTLVIRSDDADMELTAREMRRVFGVASVCLGYECEKNMDVIYRTVAENSKSLLGNAATFKCVARRSDKAFEYKSPEICAKCGEAVLMANEQVRVDVNDPDVNITIEIRDESAFIHGGGVKGGGGMPTGSSGRALLLLSGGIDSPVAGYMIARRGAEIDAVYFDTPPYTGESAREKVVALAGVLAGYTGRVFLHIVPVTEIQQAITEKCDGRMSTLLLRRFMMRISEMIALKNKCGALITGESVGQVASQTMEALAVTGSAVDIPVFRPCIGLDKEEIVTRARDIGSFKISTLPYEDCCSLFTPKHPALKPSVNDALAEEAKLDVGRLAEEAFNNRTTVKITGNGLK